MSGKIFFKITLFLLVIWILPFSFNAQPAKSESRTWIVDDDGSADFSTIQEAVNHAAEGDTIYVRAGTYIERQVTVDKPLAVIGENKNITVIDGDGTWVCIYVRSTREVVISGFTIRNGFCIYLYCSENVTVSENIISNNGQGIILIESTSNIISRNIIDSNGAVSILLDNSNKNRICENTITLNGGDAVWLDHSCENIISGNNISKNGVNIASGYHAYGIRLSYSNSNIIYHNYIIDNHEQASSWMSENNTWDNGYPSGGNYWSDYCGVDLYNGLYQNETGSDGIGDAPYVIDESNRDRYPLVFRSSGYIGDLTIGNDRIYYMSEGIFNLTGRLVIKDKALVRIQNAEVHLSCLRDLWNWMPSLEILSSGPWRTIMILVENSAKLEVDNTTFMFSSPYPFQGSFHFIYVNGFAEARITNSKFVYIDGSGDFIEATNFSKVYITNTNLTTGHYIKELNPLGGGVVSRGDSYVYIQNCSLDELFQEGNSTVVLLNSTVSNVKVYDNPTINVTDSRMEQLEIWDPANICLTNVVVDSLSVVSGKVQATKCNFQKICAGSNAKVWLHQSEAQNIESWGGGNVWFVYNLPFFGEIAVSYIYIPYIFPCVLTVAIATIVVLVYFILRKRKLNKHSQVATMPQR